MRKSIGSILIFLLISTIFRNWFMSGLLSAFDFPYYSKIMMDKADLRLYAWNLHIGLDGFAGFFSPYSWIYPFINVPQIILGKNLNLDWGFITKIIYLYPLLLLMIISPLINYNYFFPKNKFSFLSILIFSFNTYFLLLAGGEVFIALSFAFAPLVFISFVSAIDLIYGIETKKFKINLNTIFRRAIISGFFLAIQIMIEARMAFVTLFVIGLYLLFTFRRLIFHYRIHRTLLLLIISISLPGLIVILLHFYWILPTILYGKNPVDILGSSYASSNVVNFLSFAKLEQTISLLHPNWPENIFGKTYFMKPEYLLIPILAFASLLFCKKNEKKNNIIYFFAFLGLFGAYLAKGTNEPFGEIYLWLFNNIPGFKMFRDPAKLYLLIAFSYSILIPFTISKIYKLLSGVEKFSSLKLHYLLVILIASYLLFLIQPAILNQLGGMYKPTQIPVDYIKLEKYISNQPGYFRTLWVPSKQRFAYYSNSHPLISASVFFNIYDHQKLLNKLSSADTAQQLREASIKYIIVPYDSEKEIFIADRKYDNQKYLNTIKELNKIKWLKNKPDPSNNNIIFEVLNPEDHFWSNAPDIKLNYKFINPSKYVVNIENANKGDTIIFSEKYDHGWKARSTDNVSINLVNKKYKNYNSFIIPKSGSYQINVYFEYQKWADLGSVISIYALILIISLLIITNLSHLFCFLKKS